MGIIKHVTSESPEGQLEAESPTKPLRLVVVSGMSGAGRSTAAHSLEDLGWYVVDNLPPSVLPEVCRQAREIDLTRLAVVLDVRTRGFFEQLPTMFTELTAIGTLPEILFLEAADDVIVRRQESVRRPQRGQRFPFPMDAIQQPTVALERVGPAYGLLAPHDDIVGRFQEQDFRQCADSGQFGEHRR